MKKMKLAEILKNQTITTQFDFTGSCPDKDGETVSFTIFNTAYFMNEATYRFFDRELFVLDTLTAFNELVSRFTTWKNSRGAMFARLAYAYSLGYNPIENYSSIESTSGQTDLTHGLKTTHAQLENNGESITRTYQNDKIERSHVNDKDTTTYTNLTDTTARTRYGVNSSDPVPTDGDTNTRSGSYNIERTGTSTDTHTGGYKDVHSGGYSDTNSGKDTTQVNTTTTRTGNIGIQTASEMIAKEYSGLMQDLARRALEEFIDRHTFYAEGYSIWS